MNFFYAFVRGGALDLYAVTKSVGMMSHAQIDQARRRNRRAKSVVRSR